MQAIQANIKPGDTGPQVANLYAALQFLIEKGVFASSSPSELAALRDQLRSEEPSGYFKGAAVTLVQRFQVQSGLDVGLGGMVEYQTADLLNKQIKQLGAFDSGTDFVVRGTVKDANGSPQGGLVVIAFDRDLRRWQELGRAETNAEGRYEIPYRYESFRQAEGVVQPEVDLVLQVTRRLANEELEAIHVQEEPKPVPPVATVDVVLPISQEPGPSEFELATALIKPLLIGQGPLVSSAPPLRIAPTRPLVVPRTIEIDSLRADGLIGGMPRYADLRPDEIDRSDVAFVVRETELDADVVWAWAESARWTSDALRLLEGDAEPRHAATIASAGWPFFYVVLRELVAADLDGVLARGSATWESQQTQGEVRRRIPALDAVQRKFLMEALSLLARLVRIDWRRPSPTALARVLADAPLPRPVALLALDIFDQHGIEQPETYQVLAHKHSDDKEAIGRFIQALRLRATVGTDPRLARVIANEIGDVPDPLVSLASWNVDRWRHVVNLVGGDTGPLEVDAAHARAIELQLRVEQTVPMTALAVRLADHGASLNDPILSKLAPMLDAFREQAHSLLEGKPAVIGPAGPMPPEAAAVVQNLGRYLGMGVTLQGGLNLIDNGIASPGAAMTYGPDVLKQILFDLYPQSIITSLTNDLQLTANAANGFVFSVITDWRMGNWFGTSGGTPVTPQVAEIAPTLQGLFGNLDDCVCRPCESVLSLSAYLVDLLNLLKTVAKTGTTGSALQTAQSDLRARRPDIFQFDLGCEAAETEVLHIDLAIDVMKRELGPDPATQLAAAPYPWTLPFDLGFAELQPTAERLGLARRTLLALTASPPAADVAAATLRIAQTQGGATVSEWSLITTPRSGNDLADAWGVPRGTSISITDPDSGATLTGSLPTVLGRASVLLERMGLDLDVLDAVLATRYVGSLALSNRQQCKASEMMLAGQSEAVFDRLHRFTRLARKLQAWSVPLVDSALQACALPSTGRQASDYVAALQTLAAAERARVTLNLAPEVVLAMRMPLADIRLKPDATVTLFARDFKLLAPAIAAGGSIMANLDLVAGALGCGSRELATLVAATGIPKPDQVGDTLNSTSLTWLFRHVHLARALQLSVPQLVQLMLATGIDPFEAISMTLTPQAGFERLTAIHGAAVRVAASGWSVEVLADVLVPASTLAQLANRSAGLDVAQVAQPAQVTALLAALQTALREATAKVEATNSVARVEVALQPWIGNDAAARVMTALVAAAEAGASRLGTVPDAAVVALLAAPTRADYAPGNVAPLLDSTAAASLLTPNAGTTSVFATRLDTVRARLAERERERQLVATVQAATALPQDLVAQLLASGLLLIASGGVASPARQVLLADAFWKSLPATAAPPSLDETARPDLHEWMVRLHKLAALVRPGGGSDAWLRLVAYVRPAGATAFGIDWSNVIAPRQVAIGTTWTPRWAAWMACIDLRSLLDPASLGAETCTRHFERMAAGVGTSLTDADLQPLCTRLEVTATELRALAALVLGSATREAMAQPAAMRRLLVFAQVLRSAKASASQATRTLATSANADAAQVVRLLAQAQGASTATLVRIADDLRKQHRDALVALLLLKKGWRDVNRIHEHCLIDPQVQPCMRTTETLQAVAAVQQFVQRVLYGLEAGLTDVQELRRRWSWMRSYRVWEANRKVFLYPENWLFPELRDDKSSSFRLLESTLGQGELNDERARQAFGSFLDDVVQMGQVQVLGMFEDIRYDGSTPAKRTSRVLYSVARSPNPPYTHYVRRCEDFGGPFAEWTPWERVELDIQGDHVMPFVRSGSLHLVWPVVRRGSAAGLPEGATEVRMHWSRQVGRQWEKPNVSRDASTYAYSPFRDERNGFAFRLKLRANALGANVEVVCYVAKTRLETNPAATGHSGTPVEFTTFPAQPPATASSKLMYFPSQGLPFPAGRQAWPPEYAQPDRSASRTTDWVCWLKVKAGSGSAWMRLTRQANVTATLRDDAGIGGPIPLGSSETWIGFGGATQAGANTISPYAYVEPSTWRAHLTITAPVARSFSSAAVASPRVNTGESVTETLVMHIDASQYTPEELGLEFDGLLTYEAEKTFIIDAAEGIELANANGRLLGPSDVRPWMNGFQEKNLDRVEKALFLEGIHADAPLYATQVFAPGSAGTFFALPSNANRQAWEEPAVWFYAEAGSACFVDLAPGATAAGARVAVVPAAYPEANSIAAAWNAQGDITDAALQAATYGAERLPRAGSAVQSELLRRATGGSLDVPAQAQLSFDGRLPNACYQWEVFFHTPLLIADQLSKQQRFEEAERWLRFVFDPTSGGSGSDPKRFLKFRVFKDLDPRNNVTQQLTLLAQVAAGASSGDVEAVKRLIARWRDLPFRPFAIARRRHIAFLWRTVFAYLDNLLAWADSLFRRDARESIGEATLLYVHLARILGPRPKLREKGSLRPARNYDSSQGVWDDFGNLWVDTTRRIGPLYRSPPWIQQGPPSAEGFLFFCLPNNDKLSTYWTMVESRLFNIRHCCNIEGITRQLPLTDPPIDPELLVRATAAGLDLGQVIAGLYAPPPHYRYSVLAARASELAAETRALGGALLAAIEKRDAERLSQLRSANELAMLERVEAVRRLQVDEAEANLESLRATRALTESRYQQYQRLLGREGSAAPAIGATSGDESMLGRVQSGASAASGLGLIEQEGKQIEYLGHAYGWSVAAAVVKGVGGASHMTASIALASGVGAVAGEVLKAVGTGLSTTGDMFDLVSRGWQHGASHESLMAGHFRRRDEWAFQSNQALRELQQIDRQILANEIRISLARTELENQQLQIEQTQAIDDFLHDKFSNVDLYDWMVQQLSAAHFAAYRLARELALRAQASAARELGGAPLNVIGHGHWDGLRSGLLAGERLHQEVKRLEATYLERNVREHEMTKHVSLRRLDPRALVALKLDRACEFELPEWLFDLDAPGHYARRLKSVSLTVPCVVGPYGVVNCKLILLSSRTRVSADNVQNTTAYLATSSDARFDVRYGASESIITSTGRDDSGLFETSLRDERFLPFEGAGAISWWRLELPGAVPQFDHDTISDVILHIRYTARDGGESMRYSAKGQFGATSTAPPMAAPRPLVLVSARDEFSAEWSRASEGASELVVKLDANLLPYWMLKGSLRFAELATLDIDGSASRDPITKWRRGDTPTNPPRFTLSATGALSANLGAIAPNVDDRLIFLTMGV